MTTATANREAHPLPDEPLETPSFASIPDYEERDSGCHEIEEARLLVLQSPDSTALEIEAAFSELYHDHYPYLYRQAASLIGAQTAEDILQDTFLKLWAKRNGLYASRGSLRPYLRTLVRNAAYNQARNSARKKTSVLNDGDTTGMTAAPSTEEQALARLRFRETVRGVGHTPDRHKETLRLVASGADTATIAAYYGIKEGATRVRVHRARQAAQKAVLEHTGIDVTEEFYLDKPQK